MTGKIDSITAGADYIQSAGGAAATPDTQFSEVFESAVTDKPSGTTLDDIFERAAKKYGISADLLKAVAKVESNFNPNAVSPSGAEGVMQLMPKTAASLGVTDSFDAEQNIMGGAKYLKENLDRFGGDESLALAAYYGGPNNVVKYGYTVPPFAEGYVEKVNAALGGSLEIPAARNAVVNSSRKQGTPIVYTQGKTGLETDIPVMFLTALYDKISSDEDDNKIPM